MLQFNFKMLLSSSADFLFYITDRALAELFRQICLDPMSLGQMEKVKILAKQIGSGILKTFFTFSA